MPELPEVETVVRGLRGAVVGRTFTWVHIDCPPQIGDTSPDAFSTRLIGQRIYELKRRGKYIIFDLSDDYLLIHLKMTGRLYVLPAGQARDEDRWVRAAFGLDDRNVLHFSDSRKFGRLYLVAQVEEITGGLGPEPLTDEFTLDLFRARLAERTGAIKPLLINQSFVAGIGNIYADEALWQSQIDPRRRANTLRAEEVECLYRAIRSVLQDGIDHEGASISWYRKPDGTAGTQQARFSVYDRAGEPCPRCGTVVNKIRLGQRGTHFCPVCQR